MGEGGPTVKSLPCSLEMYYLMGKGLSCDPCAARWLGGSKSNSLFLNKASINLGLDEVTKEFVLGRHLENRFWNKGWVQKWGWRVNGKKT